MDLTDAIDVHVHSAPDVYERLLDDIELANAAKSAGMKALILKSHHTLTADRAALVHKHTGMQTFGGLVLNQTVGGFNRVAVETAIEFGARQIWMPTIHAQHCMDVAQQPMFQAEVKRGRQGLSPIENGVIHPDLMEILELIRDADIILGTGHLAPAESLALLDTAQRMGIRRMLVTHPLMCFTRFTGGQLRQAVEVGAKLEFDYLSCSPNWQHAIDPKETANCIQAIGPANCVMGTDGGQRVNPPAPEMMLQFALAMQKHGIARDDLKRMVCINPADLLQI